MPTEPEQKLDLTTGFGRLLVRSPNINVELTDDGRVVVHKGTVEQPNRSAKVEFAKALKTGDVIPDGPNKGWIYCEGRNVAPFLVAPKDSGVMQWREAMAFADRETMALPTREQLQVMYDARNTSALKNTFNITVTHPACWYWSATQQGSSDAWCQHFSDGFQGYCYKYHKSSVRCVRPCTPV